MPSALKTSLRIFMGGILALPLSYLILTAIGISPKPLMDEALQRVPVELVSWSGFQPSMSGIDPWPPIEGESYPDLVLSDQHGNPVRLSDFAGKVILLELAAIPCQGCQAFAGGNELGGFAGVPVQPGLSSIVDYTRQFAGVELGKDEDVVFIQLLLYGESMSNPTQKEVTDWAKHFEMHRENNEIVLRGERSMLGRASYQMIPGFHLIDRDFVLRYDSSGHHPTRDLYRDLLPALGKMSRESISKSGMSVQ